MPIPFLLIGLGAGTAAMGVGKTVKAGKDQKEARSRNEEAEEIVNNAVKSANKCRENSGAAITDLGEKKIWILNHSITSFIISFEKLHNVDLIVSEGLEELGNLKLDKQTLGELKEMKEMASSLLTGTAGGAALGAITAFGAYGGAMTFGAASTGTAIASLSGAAATNATLAFLGGGALSVGGLGIAGGTAVLGGLVAGPALAVMGFVVGANASKNKDQAYANLEKAKEYREEMKTVEILCKGIRARASMFYRLLVRLDGLFEPMIYSLEQVIKTNGTDYATFTTEQKQLVATVVSMAKTIKTVLDTPILTENGELTPESENIAKKMNALIGAGWNE